MSCIPKILEMKGDKEFLVVPTKVRESGYSRGIVVEDGGRYRDYDFIITFTDMGFRCGYVAVDQNHKFFETKSHDMTWNSEFDVHGGVTFFDESHISEALLGDNACKDKWIGFDAGHAWDGHDLECAIKYFPDLREVQKEHIQRMGEITRGDENWAIRTKDFMVQECKKLIDQIIADKEAA